MFEIQKANIVKKKVVFKTCNGVVVYLCTFVSKYIFVYNGMSAECRKYDS